MHPGQQLVSISNMASGRQVRFQMESDRTRSHCEVSKRKMQSDPYDWAFEYLGVNEEDGQVLRHFRARVLTLDGTDAIARSVIEFWDVAESMQPHRQISGGTEVVVYDSFKIVSDSDVEAAVETRTGKTIADLLKCNERDAYRESRPEMSLLDDLSETDAAYYKASSSTKSETFSRYLDATLDPKTMPDVCYEKCKSLLDAVKMAEISTDICDGPVEGALECLKQTGLQECLSSVFFESHANECDRQALDSNNTVRTLEESEDAMEELKAIEVLVNETPRKNRRLGHYTYNLPTNKDYWSSADRYRATVEELMPERTASGRYTHEKEVWDRLEKQQPGRGTGSNPLSSGAIRAINNQDVDWKHWCKTEGTDTQSYNYQRCWEITTCTTNYMWKFSVESEGERKGSPNEKVVRACCINAMDSTQKFFSKETFLDYANPRKSSKARFEKDSRGNNNYWWTLFDEQIRIFFAEGKIALCLRFGDVESVGFAKCRAAQIAHDLDDMLDGNKGTPKLDECLKISNGYKESKEFGRCQAQYACTSKYSTRFLCKGVHPDKALGTKKCRGLDTKVTNGDINVEWIELWCVKAVDKVINLGIGGVNEFFSHRNHKPKKPNPKWSEARRAGWYFATQLDWQMMKNVELKEYTTGGGMGAFGKIPRGRYWAIKSAKKHHGRQTHFLEKYSGSDLLSGEKPSDAHTRNSTRRKGDTVDHADWDSISPIKLQFSFLSWTGPRNEKISNMGSTCSGECQRVSEHLNSERKDETKCYKLGMSDSWEYKKCREAQLAMPIFAEEFRYGWTVYAMNDERDGMTQLESKYIELINTISTEEEELSWWYKRTVWYKHTCMVQAYCKWFKDTDDRMIFLAEKRLVESWAKRALDSYSQEDYLYLREAEREAGTFDYFSKSFEEKMRTIRNEELKKFQDDLWTEQCLKEGETPYTFKYAKCQSKQTCMWKYLAEFKEPYEEHDRISQWCSEAIDITQSKYPRGDRQMMDGKKHWHTKLDTQMQRILEKDIKQQEELAKTRQDRAGIAADQKMAEKVKLTFNCPGWFGLGIQSYEAEVLPGKPWSLFTCMKFGGDAKSFGAFVLEFGWTSVFGKYAIYVKLETCVPIGLIFGIPPFLYCKFCVGGGIQFRLWSDCPQVDGVSMMGSAFMKLEAGFEVWFASCSASVSIEIEVGTGWYMAKTKDCRDVITEGPNRRRRKNRRREKYECTLAQACDVYVAGRATGHADAKIVGVSVAAKVTLEIKYWIKKKQIEIKIICACQQLFSVAWYEAYSKTIYRKKI